MQSTSEYLGDLDLANEQRLTERRVQIWIIESSSVWGNVWSIVETECAWRLETERFCQRGWNSEVSPNRGRVKGLLTARYLLFGAQFHKTGFLGFGYAK